jgi:hypothetical protein
MKICSFSISSLEHEMLTNCSALDGADCDALRTISILNKIFPEHKLSTHILIYLNYCLFRFFIENK